MTKQEILSIYRAADAVNKRMITSHALDILADCGIVVDRRSLAYWRKNEMIRSPLEKKYRIAYSSAISAIKSAMKPAKQ